MEVKFLNTGIIPLYLILLGVLIYLTFLAYSIVQIISDKKKRQLVFLRTLVWSLLIFSLINPIVTFYQNKKVKNKFIFLIDNSASMMVKDSNGETRFKRAVNIIKSKFGEKVGKKNDIDYYLFSSEVKSTSIEDLKQGISYGDGTDIENGISSLPMEIRNGISGIFLLSDGINTVYSDPLKQAKILKNLNIPLFTYDFSKGENIRDISLYDIDFPEEAVGDEVVPITLKVFQTGFNGVNENLRIYINDKLYKSENIRLNNSINIYKVNLKFSQLGINKIDVKLGTFKGEVIKINNSRTIFIRSFKSKFKMLFVYGKVSWEYKFIKYSLSLDPNIDLESFIRTTKDSLLPLDKISLSKFDLIVIGNIKYRDLPHKFVDNVLRYTAIKSGALLFLGGEDSFKNGDYHISKLKDIIPVDWEASGEIYKGDFTIKLTEMGLNSPVMKSGIGDISTIQREWDNLPPLHYLNIIKKVKPGVQVFGVCSANPNFVVVAIGKYKRAKVGIFTAYPTWKWGFLPVGLGNDNSLFLSFWRQLVRYLVMSNEDSMNLTTDKLMYKRGENIVLRASMFDKNYSPIIRSKVVVNLYYKKENKYERLKDVTLNPLSSTKGVYEKVLNLDNFGNYLASLNIGGKRITTYFVIEKPSNELFKLNTDKDLLNKMSKITGGKFINDYSQLDDVIGLIKGGRNKIRVRYELVLWSGWLPLLLIIIALGYEWYYRKRTGLL